ncbi:hypothetical protein DWW10_15770 [Bacteroides intestinalis]|jgi:hypothetical protein|uniref:Uncharacterized protein n=1 Tax=Bacteroides intestinalis TaxID=329854 RepID=A0A412Y2A6_9BACE|nr:hypothetical protein [Bacteroides intestinalis]RGV51562.1 hypothetical protein DWW10_15770 [Bacteroides intestinalis]RHA57997.1 hypothetical protein DW932_17130 [Bacteroides intestinalis]
MELSLNPTEWYMKLLAPLSPDIKLDLISKLSESLKEKVSHSEKTILKSEDFFSALSGAWEDDTSVEEEMKIIRDSRTSNRTRKMEKF